MPSNNELLRLVETRVKDAMRDSTLTDCYRWANARRWIEDEDYSGYYSADEYPYIVGVQNSDAPFNVMMKSAQTGGSEAVINRALYEVDHRRRNVIYVLPTTKAADIFSKTRFANAIKYSPYLLDRITDSVDVKQIGGYSLYIKGAKNDINLKSTPASVLILDEVSELEDKQIWLAMTRLDGHRNSMLWAISTPKFPGLGIHKLYLSTTQEHYFFKCPHCSKFIEFLYPDSFVICGEEVDDPDVRRSHLICTECKMKLEHDAKPQFLQGGEWVGTNDKADKSQRGFYLPQFYSPKKAPYKMAMDYHRGRGDEEANAEFWRSGLGLPYIQEGSRVTDLDINECLGNFATMIEPVKKSDRLLVTLGIDRGPWNYWVAVAWSVAMGQGGDVNDRAKGKLIGFGKFNQENQEAAHALMRRFRVLGCAQDADPHRSEARKLCRKFNLTSTNYVWLCQYVEGRVARDITLSDDETGAPMAKVDKAAWAAMTLGRIMGARIELPRDITLELRTHLKNLIREVRKSPDGNFETRYFAAGPDHFANAMIYAEVALRLINLDALTGDGVITSIHS